MFRQAIIIPAIAVTLTTASAAEMSREAIEAASFTEGEALPPAEDQSPLVFKLQVLLDRADISPGILDGYYGENVEVAVRTFAEREELETDGRLDEELWRRLGGDGDEVLTEYEITREDVSGPFVEEIPDSFEAMAEMQRLAYTGPEELLAEKFHMHVEVLKGLNPEADFSRVGSRIVVAAVRADVIEDESLVSGADLQTDDDASDMAAEDADRTEGTVVRIEVDKDDEQLRGYGADDKLLVAYPATIGSTANPSPSGRMEVVVVVHDPNYTYTPDLGIDGPDEALQLPPGPNGPVGSIWIDLEKEGYGIHGTAEPADIRKEQSHGCVRLTNWDAEELAALVEEGTMVEFLDGGSSEEDG